MTYPHVLSEAETLRAVVAGQSLARYGDGEFNLVMAGPAKAQRYDPLLSQRLRGILTGSGACLVGVPNIHSDTPKTDFWRRYLQAALFLDDRTYGSAFVTRPDSAPWIDTPEYWALLEQLWVGQSVTLVRGTTRSLTTDDLTGALAVREVIAPAMDAWSDYARLMDEIGTPERVLLCLGPTATVLAWDLAARGVHAVDLGHVGMFLKKHRRGEPMVVTAEDRAA